MKINSRINVLTDSNVSTPSKTTYQDGDAKKGSKKSLLTKEDKKKNQILFSDRLLNDNVIGMLKRFKIISGRYKLKKWLV
ncbi:MAG: hypothetical protein ACOVOR_03990 [Rhabdochlamydiaceae bacterium]